MDNLPTISRFEVFKYRNQILKNPLPFHHRNFQKFGDIFKVHIGFRKSIVFTRNPKHIRQVLQTQHKKYHKSPLQTVDLAKYIGHGILTSNGEHWRTHRRMVQPAFHKKKLEGLLGMMRLAIRSELKRINPNVEEDVYPLMGDLAFQVVAKSLFSRSDIQEDMAKLQEITEANQKMLIKEMRQPYLKWWFGLRGQIKQHIKLSQVARDLLNTIIEARIGSGEEKDDLLDMLLQARYEDGSPMSRRQLIDEVLILFTAGHETTANALSFTLFLLAKHKKIQERVFKEVSQVEWASDDILQHITQLKYTKQCIEEAMRLYPPVYIIDRMAIEDDSLGEIEIPKNTLILLSIYELHRYSGFWDSPGDFNPDRFKEDNTKNLQEYYYPFGAGPRMCVGNNFAMYEMVMTIAEIIKKYSLKTSINAVEINPLISLKPKAVPLRFVTR
ncbi:cytochrome P450 [Maribacter polysaccharolyticus]|uniref:cytochrome P450 n=1 Tax=Maribacter polysaccharolyticus TaxID=3020831 RepID=UPI00237F2212|nr:cytochrome P450 [Maribacter polysaccharolyticus]MDE3741425.1 cytochrome P450 [Maribacter polysaccharolyticus]